MSKNTKTYLLLAVVLFIWAAVGYRIFSGLGTPETSNTPTTQVAQFKPKERVLKDTFSIAANYRDPFLGTVPKKKKRVKARTTKLVVPEVNISYTGSVISTEQKNSIFFITIEGTQILLKPKKTIQGVTLVSGSKKQIKIRYKGKLRTIPLQK